MKRKNKSHLLIFFVLLTLVVVRVLIPQVILNFANKEINNIHPGLKGEIGDVDISFLKRQIEFQDVSLIESKSREAFLKITNLQTSFFIQDFSKKMIGVDIIMSGLNTSISKSHLNLAKEIMAKYKKGKKDTEKKKEDKEKFITVGASSFQLSDGNIQFLDYPGLKTDGHFTVNNVSGVVKNLLPDEKKPTSTFNLTASLEGDGKLKTFGKLKLNKKPIEWEIDSNLTSFSLPDINKLLKEKIPITFTKGELEVYVEALSQKGKIIGYVKPYLKDIDVVKNKEKFLGAKHRTIEIISAISNLILRNPDSKTVTTRVPFEFDKKLKIDTGEALDKVLENAFEKKLPLEMENSLKLK